LEATDQDPREAVLVTLRNRLDLSFNAPELTPPGGFTVAALSLFSATPPYTVSSTFPQAMVSPLLEREYAV